MNHDDRDATEASRLSAARVRPTDDGRQSAEPGDRSRARETDTTSKALPPLADAIPQQRDSRIEVGALLDALGQRDRRGRL